MTDTTIVQANPSGYFNAASHGYLTGDWSKLKDFYQEGINSSAERVLANADKPNESLLDLYKSTGDIEYLEKHIDNMLAEKAANDARSFQKMQDDTQYSRAFKDIEKAGYNPWLLLQGSIGTAGSGNYSAASYSKNSASQAVASRANQASIAEQNNQMKLIVGIIAAAAVISKVFK